MMRRQGRSGDAGQPGGAPRRADQLIDERVVYARCAEGRHDGDRRGAAAVIARHPRVPRTERQVLARSATGAAARAGHERRRMFEADAAQGPHRRAAARSASPRPRSCPTAVVDASTACAQQKREVSQTCSIPRSSPPRSRSRPKRRRPTTTATRSEFELPRRSSVEYVDPVPRGGRSSSVTVTPRSCRNTTRSARPQFGKPEERRASHILIAVPASATPEQKAKAKEKAEALLAQAKKSPEELRRAGEEEFRGSRLGRGRRRPRLLRARQDGQAVRRGGVRHEGRRDRRPGRNAVRLSHHQARRDQGRARRPSFEAVKAQDRGGAAQGARPASAFAEAADEFSNLVYEQPDSLKPAVDEFKLDSCRPAAGSRARAATIAAAEQREVPARAVLRRRAQAQAATPRRSRSRPTC